MTRDVRVPAAPLRTRTPTDHLALVVRVSLARQAVLRVEGPYEATNVGVELKGVIGAVIESEGPWAERHAGR